MFARRLRRGGVAETMPSRRTVISSDRSITSCSLCEMKISPRPSAVSWRKRREQSSTSGGSAPRGLVEHQQLRVSVQRLQDLGALPLPNGQLPDVGVGVDLEPVLFGHLDPGAS